MRKLEIKSLNDLTKDLTPEMLNGMESCYRRGYTQGFAACMQTKPKNRYSLYNLLLQWRAKRLKQYLPPFEGDL